MASKLIGKTVYIKNSSDWGIVKGMDNGSYLVAMFDGPDQVLLNRDEFTVKRGN